MKTTLIVIQDEADHADAKKLIEKLMKSSDPKDLASSQFYRQVYRQKMLLGGDRCRKVRGGSVAMRCQ